MDVFSQELFGGILTALVQATVHYRSTPLYLLMPRPVVYGLVLWPLATLGLS